MTYRLKDRALQNRLDELTDGALSRQFEKDDWIRLLHEGTGHYGIIYYGETLGDTDLKRYALVFREDELEEVDDDFRAGRSP